MNETNNNLNFEENNKRSTDDIDTELKTHKEDSDVKDNKDIEKSIQTDNKVLEEKVENNVEEKSDDEAQKALDGEKVEGTSKDVPLNGNAQPQYSSCYKPPYYVPNFTVAQQPTATQQPPKQEKKKSSKAWIIILVAALSTLVFLFTFFVGTVMVIISAIGGSVNDQGVDMDDEQMTIIQNAPQIQINKNTDPDYVPQSLPEVVSKVGNSVVEIKTSSRVSDRFYGQYVTSGAGSGVLVTQSEKAGYLITNHHVIHNEDSSVVDTITVVLANGEEYNATKIDSDYSIDLAVLRIEKKADETFTVAQFGDSSKLVVGQDVIAIGNPLGSLGGTVTDGIISALDRRVQVEDVTMVLLQHNAAINPGNSGGALFDMMGNLIGIVNAKTSESGIEGLGFAIPANIAFDYFNRVMVIEPALGIRVAYGRLNTMSPLGVYVVDVSNDKFQKRDRIIKVNGQNIETAADYYAIIDCCKPGDTVTITVERSGQTLDIAVVLPE